MQYLIDTHVFLWFVSNSKELSQTARTLKRNLSEHFQPRACQVLKKSLRRLR